MGTRGYIPLAPHRPRALLASVAVLLLASVIVPSSAPVRAASDVVTTCASRGPGSLPELLAAAAANATLTFAQDCTDANAITLTDTLIPSVNLTLDATAPARAITISGGGNVRLFAVKSGITLALRGLTLANGNTTADGQTAPDSKNPAGGFGGAIYNVGVVSVERSTFSGNTATKGGGAISNEGTATVTSSIFSANTTRIFGGAIFNIGTLNVISSTLSGNAATSAINSGGAIAILGHGIANVAGCAFAGNVASYGGAVNNSSTLNVVNSTFFSNIANDGDGGAIDSAGYGALNVIGSTFSGNSAGRAGGALSFRTGWLALSTIAGNAAPTGPDIDGSVTTDGGGNVIGNTAGTSGLTDPSNKLNADPLLAPFAENGGSVQTFALMPGSPAIGIAACPTDPITMVALATDARGVSRPQSASCDAGSYQTVASP